MDAGFADTTIALPQHSLANLVHAAYVDFDRDAPAEVIRQLLEPYHIDADQVEALARVLYWPGRHHVSHPLYAIVKEIMNIGSPTQRKCLNEVNKERFLRLATSISHAWITEHGLRSICSYQGVAAAVPHAWLHIDDYGLITLCTASKGMVALSLHVHRSCPLGTLADLHLDLNDVRGAPYGCSYLDVYVAAGSSDTVELDTWLAEDGNVPNYALFFTRSSTSTGCRLIRAFLCSPSLQRSWSLPVMVHPLELP